MKPVLLAGETFLTTSFVVLGSRVASSASTVNGATAFIAALARRGIDVEQIGGEQCEQDFPRSVAALSRYAAVVISDVGALSLLLTPEARRGLAGPNRLDVLRRWVEEGGGLMMAGGYAGFQGMDGMARFHDSPLEDCLPVTCLPHSDGLEAPEGLRPALVAPGHPILAGVPSDWPLVLGLNKLVLRESSDVELVAECVYRGRNHPLLALRRYGRGRALTWATDIGPHWLSADFISWPGYEPLLANMMTWLADG